METPTIDFSDEDVNDYAATGVSFEDYLRQFEGKHAEWLAGKVVVYMSNNEKHQAILLFLSALLTLYLGMKNLGKVFLAGFPMFLADDQPAPEPDLLVVFNEHLARVKPTYLDGAADICVEIVSPESVKRDYGRKFGQYEAAGVREYWRVDPIRKQADFYALRDVDGEPRYQRITPDAQGRFVSTLLPGFTLHPDLFWREELPTGMELVELAQAMTR
ncbi:MAG: Uma2 family endonuclease [Anaerolineae bacterium]